jgi:aryl-alcohol dehydrogenase-like predicted oxidoreductase
MTLGRRTGLRVSEYALGTGNFGTRRSAGSEPDQARAVFDRFAEAGGVFIDTSASYQFGQAEELLGGFLRSDRDHFVVATKYTNPTTPHPRISDTGNNRKNMVRSLEASLRRLGTDYIDLYWAHSPDTITPIEEIVAAFDDLVRAGKIHYAGLSNSRRGARRGRPPSPSCGASRRSSPFRSNTACCNAAPNGNSCRWPTASVWVSPCGRPSQADC